MRHTRRFVNDTRECENFKQKKKKWSNTQWTLVSSEGNKEVDTDYLEHKQLTYLRIFEFPDKL